VLKTDHDRDFHSEGVVINSDKYNGMRSEAMREKILKDFVDAGVATEQINYKMRDWLISRQRYWGAPIPIIHCPKDGAVPVPDKDLPVTLPDIKSYEPGGDGRSPLANVPEFVQTTCPKCGGNAERETDTMDGFACSSWYFLRFADPHNKTEAFGKTKAEQWLPVDDYIGGAEHAVMHLLYARFWTKVMFDEGLVSFQEPFQTLRNHGMILAPDGQKMSKSKGNTIEPDGLIEQGYGADAIRIMELFIGPWNQMANWSVEGMGGSFRFLQRSWMIVQEYLAAKPEGKAQSEITKAAHQTIAKVSKDLEELGFNTAIAALMEYVNTLFRAKLEGGFTDAKAWKLAVETLVQLLAPFAPHISEELWQELGHTDSVHISEWPVHDPKYLVSDEVAIVVQVNGKVRATITVPANSDEATVVQAAKAEENVQKYLGADIKKTVFVPGRLVNFVV
jgi:leucyl-tRNA synthetase